MTSVTTTNQHVTVSASAQATLTSLLPAIARSDLSAMWAFVVTLMRALNATYDAVDMPKGGYGAKVAVSTRHITGPVLRYEEDFAAWLHELGHLVVPCEGRLHAQRVWRDDAGGLHERCLACEREAWAQAMRWVPFTRAMFDHAAAALRTYRFTPAPTETQQLANRQCARITWHEDRQRRARLQLRREQVEAERLSLVRQCDALQVHRWRLDDARRALDRLRA